MDDDSSSLAELITRKKEQTGETFDQLAARFGVSQPTVSRWANGKSNPADENIPGLAKWLGRHPGTLLVMIHKPHMGDKERITMTADDFTVDAEGHITLSRSGEEKALGFAIDDELADVLHIPPDYKMAAASGDATSDEVPLGGESHPGGAEPEPS